MTLNRETGITETHIRIQHPDGSVQESVQREGYSVISHLLASPSSLVSKEQSPMPVGETESIAPLSSVRERWAQRRQERMEQREESREERRRTRQERRRELREAEAMQREATAAAYGLVVHSSIAEVTDTATSDNNTGKNQVPEAMTTNMKSDQYHAHVLVHPHHEESSRIAWRQRREERRQERERQMGQEESEEQDHESPMARTWPPRGYLRRVEREQEPRRNV